MKITYFAATSLDGFIAKEDGDVSWLDDLNIDANETGLEEFFANIDGLVMGRSTYDFIFNYGSWPYEDKPTWVCTHSELSPMPGAHLLLVNTVGDAVEGAKSKDLEHLWLVGGGRLASSFLEESLITHLSISEMPVTLESGIPLFAAHKLEDIPAAKREVIPKTGFTQINISIRSDIEK